MKKVRKISKSIMEIKFSFDRTAEGRDEFYGTLQKVKTLPGRKYKENTKSWNVPITFDSVEKLCNWQFDIDMEILEWYTKAKQDADNQLELFPNTQTIVYSEEFYPFQNEGIAFIEKNKGKALIADQMGLGKTIQALGWLRLHPELRPAVIVCPASLKLNWKKEIDKWIKIESVTILKGREPHEIGTANKKGIIIINYDILFDWVGALKKFNSKVLICDECHYIKNTKTKRTRAVKSLAKKIKYKIFLSGTPIVNKPIEFYNTLSILKPDLFPSRWQFVERYCGLKHNGFGFDYSGASNTEELHKILTESIMIRRLKKDVLEDLPEKQFSVVPFEIGNRKEYEFAERDLIAYIRGEEGEVAANNAADAETLVQFEKLKQIAVKGKLEQCMNWIEDFLESGEKLVVFCTHHIIIDSLMKYFSRIAVKLDGRNSAEEKDNSIESFQNNSKIKLFVGNIKAAGVGITLTESSNVCFMELGWTPGEMEQAEDRCHRIGQDADSVNIYYLIAQDTIEEDIAHMIDSKKKVLAAVLDGKEVEQESLLNELLNKYKEKAK